MKKKLFIKKVIGKITKNILSSFFSPKTLINAYLKKVFKKNIFYFNGNELSYIYNSHNNDNRLKERSIEIPIICYYLKKSGIINVLEIGNVSNYYYEYFSNLINTKTKTVIDRYEKGLGIINKDIKYFKSKNKFNFIFSISTFEHMDSCGGRESYGETDNFHITFDSIYGTVPLYELPYLNDYVNSHAADNIFRVVNDLLNPKGKFIITAPVGYTPEWDELLFKSDILNKEFLNISSIKIYYMKKINQIEWKQTDISEAKKGKYNYPFNGTNVLSIIVIIK